MNSERENEEIERLRAENEDLKESLEELMIQNEEEEALKVEKILAKENRHNDRISFLVNKFLSFESDIIELILSELNKRDTKKKRFQKHENICSTFLMIEKEIKKFISLSTIQLLEHLPPKKQKEEENLLNLREKKFSHFLEYFYFLKKGDIIARIIKSIIKINCLEKSNDCENELKELLEREDAVDCLLELSLSHVRFDRNDRLIQGQNFNEAKHQQYIKNDESSSSSTLEENDCDIISSILCPKLNDHYDPMDPKIIKTTLVCCNKNDLEESQNSSGRHHEEEEQKEEKEKEEEKKRIEIKVNHHHPQNEERKNNLNNNNNNNSLLEELKLDSQLSGRRRRTKENLLNPSSFPLSSMRQKSSSNTTTQQRPFSMMFTNSFNMMKMNQLDQMKKESAMNMKEEQLKKLLEKVRRREEEVKRREEALKSFESDILRLKRSSRLVLSSKETQKAILEKIETVHKEFEKIKREKKIEKLKKWKKESKKRKNKNKQQQRPTGGKLEIDFDSIEEDNRIQNVENKEDKEGESVGEFVCPIPMKSIVTEFMELESQFSSVSKKHFTIALANMAKNRYGNVLPYNHNVVLMKHDRYINASECVLNGIKYISCQWPLGPEKIEKGESIGDTFIDFWSMVYYTKAKVIVVLQQPNQYHPYYWPNDLGVKKFKKYTISGISIEKGKIFDSYRLSLSKKRPLKDLFGALKGQKKEKSEDGKDIVQEVHLLVYKCWPDHGIPSEFDSLYEIMKKADDLNNIKKRKKEVEPPIICHCSAGIGRTGVFLACHNLLRKNWGTAKIGEVLFSMRKQRLGMIQTVTQYKYTYDFVWKYAEHEKKFLRMNKEEEDDGIIC